MTNTIVQNYQFIRQIGEGGMATVWLGNHTTLQKPVAIKVLNKEFSNNEEIRKRFLAEARSLFEIHHPNIVRVTDLIDQPDTAAIIMEYIEGHTLKEEIQQKGPLAESIIRDWFSQMTDALAHVHECGIIHRDVKPSNFMISKNGRIRMLDFGIAKHQSGKTDLQQTGTTNQMGTPMYMSPEQVRSTRDVTTATDIYSLGVVLWQSVTGRKPYEDDTLSTFDLQLKIVQEPLAATGTMWDSIISTATEKDPARRFANMKAYAKAIKDLPSKSQEKAVDQDKTKIENSDLTKIDHSKSETLYRICVKTSENEFRFGFIRKNGEVAIPPVFESIEDDFDDHGLVKVKKDWKYGFINQFGNWIVQPIFDSLDLYDKNGWAKASINSRFGFIDRTGNWVIQPIFDSIDNYEEKWFAAAINNKHGLIDRNGNWIIQPLFDQLGVFRNDSITSASINSKEGFIDQEGRWIIQPMFDEVEYFDEKDMASAQLNSKWGFIDRRGNWIIQPTLDSVESFNNEDCTPATINSKYGLIDRSGNWLIQPIYDSLSKFDETSNLALAQLNSKYGFIDKNGKWIIQPMFDSLEAFDEGGLAKVQINSKYGFIDRKGNWIVQPMFDSLGSFNNKEYAEASVNSKYGFINRNGNWIVQPVFDNFFTDFWDGWFSGVSIHGGFDDNGLAPAGLGEKYGWIDTKGNWIIPPKYDISKNDSSVRCPRCLGKGHVDQSDINRLNQQANWLPGPCAFCDKKGVVSYETFKKIRPENEIPNEDLIVSEIEDLEDIIPEFFTNDIVDLGESIPDKKLRNFCNQFNADFMADCSFYVYYDDTVFGKGDNGFLIGRISENPSAWYLFTSDLGGEPQGFNLTLENDNANKRIISVDYPGHLVLTLLDPKTQSHESFKPFGTNSNEAFSALHGFLQKITKSSSDPT